MTYRMVRSTLRVGDKIRLITDLPQEDGNNLKVGDTGWVVGPDEYADGLHYVQIHGKGIRLLLESRFEVTLKVSRWYSFKQKWALNGTCYGYFPTGGYGSDID